MTEVSESLSPESQLLEAMNAHELLAQLFTDAHTAYTFTEEPVTDEEVHAAYDLAKWAQGPSSRRTFGIGVRRQNGFPS